MRLHLTHLLLIFLSFATNPRTHQGLSAQGYEIVSTGGSAKVLEDANVPVSHVETLTQFPEMLDGRVKTLHPAVHGGILARRDLKNHMDAMSNHSFGLIDIVICNLYPFRATVTSSHKVPFQDAIENIDIGGPTMIRAAAKNHQHVLVVVDPADYPTVLDSANADGESSSTSQDDLRRRLAWKAFQHVSTYDSNVAEWLWENGAGDGGAPPERTIPMKKVQSLRYGENPHQGKEAFAICW